jgi:ATP-dependent DNA helicase DinG
MIKKESSRFFEAMRDMVPLHRNHFRIKDTIPNGSVLVDLLKAFLVLMTETEGVFGENHPMRGEFDIARGMLFSFAEHLSSFVAGNRDTHVYWIERDAGAILGDIILRGQPVGIDEIFKKEIIHCYESSIFVSATLAVGDDFSYITNRLGIENAKNLHLKTPFDYQSQAVLYVARDLADPSSPRYGEEASRDAAEIINHLCGNCLMLFTSYKTLREVKEALVGMLPYPIHSQDEMTSTEAYERYVNAGDSVLMGTHSFWQGVDLPGDLVRGVLLMKLPFAVPDLPPVEAKIERISEQGKNPFAALQIPEAVIRFRQGFGRLIRSGKDRGVVAVLDSRIVTRPYGRLFLKSIPECRVVYSIQELKDAYSLISC